MPPRTRFDLPADFRRRATAELEPLLREIFAGGEGLPSKYAKQAAGALMPRLLDYVALLTQKRELELQTGGDVPLVGEKGPEEPLSL